MDGWVVGWVCAAVVTGCGPAIEVDSGDTSGSTGSTPPVVSTAAPQPPGLPPDPSTSGPLPTTTGVPPDPSTTTGTTGEPPMSVCDPQPAETFALVDIEQVGAPGSSVRIDSECFVEFVDSTDERTEVLLLCLDEPVADYRLTIRSEPTVAISTVIFEPQVLDVRASRVYPIDYGGSIFIALREVDGDLILGQYGYGTPPQGVDITGWFAPIAFGPIDGLCDVDSWDTDPGGGGFIMDGCPSDIRRMAINFIVGGSSTQVFDRNRALVGRYDIHVAAAYRDIPVPKRCDEPESTVIQWAALPLSD